MAEGVGVPETQNAQHASTRRRGRHVRRPPLVATGDPVLELRGVTARAPGGRLLLDDVSFSVQRGWLVAVVGPTGAGKTSLARALTGSLALEGGAIRLDGSDLAVDGSARDRLAFVPQDDVLHRQLDLRRTLAYAASLRLPRSLGGAERGRRVGSALEELGLEGHADLPISALSGGQRKRANIAAELVGQPDVLVLDEPTSGLDPGYEKAVLDSLRELADAGRTVIAVTHSMQALSRCDRVLFLAEGGRVAYFGPPSGVAGYFGGSDAADVFQALDAESGQTWKERFQAHPAYARYVAPALGAAARVVDRGAPEAEPISNPGPRSAEASLAPARARWRHQVVLLLRRQVDLLRADRRHLALLLLQGPLLGLLIRAVLAPDSLQVLRPGVVTPASQTVALFVALSATWLGASNAVREIVKERHILRREVDAGLLPSAYVASKALVLGLLAAVQSAVLAVVACSAQHPADGGAVLGSAQVELMAAAALAGVAATGLGLLLSGLVSSPDRAIAVLPMLLVTELTLAGSWAVSSTAPGLGIVRDLTGARWGVEMIDATVLGDGSRWIGGALSLAALALGALAGTVALVHRQTRPARRRTPLATHLDALGAGVRTRRGAWAGALASVSLLLGLGAAAGIGGVSGAPAVPSALAAGAEAAPEAAVAPVVDPVVVDTTIPAAPPSTASATTVTTVETTTPAPPPVAVAETPTTAPEVDTTTTTTTTTTTHHVPPTTPTTVVPPLDPAPSGAATGGGTNPWLWPWQLAWAAMAAAWRFG